METVEIMMEWGFLLLSLFRAMCSGRPHEVSSQGCQSSKRLPSLLSRLLGIMHQVESLALCSRPLKPSEFLGFAQ